MNALPVALQPRVDITSRARRHHRSVDTGRHIFSGVLLACWLGLCAPAAAQPTAIVGLRPARETEEDCRLQIHEAQQFTRGADLWAGVDTHRLLSADTFDRIRAARRLGVDGIMIWNYDTATERARMPPEHRQRIGLAIAACSTP